MSKKSQTVETPKTSSEEIIKARAVSRGLAIGKIVCLYGRKRQFYRVAIKDSQIEKELKRFSSAVKLAANQLKKIGTKKNVKLAKAKTGIFAAHLLILEDRTLHTQIENYIRTEKTNAEWAVKTVTEKLVAQYKAIPDLYLRERYIDLEDVADRVLNALGGTSKSQLKLEKNSIIAARELKPSTLIEFAESHPQAIITENGGWTSHSFILAREMNLPAVTGAKRILRQLKNGDEVIVDGYEGQIILHPQKKTVKNYKTAADEFILSKSIPAENKAGNLQTLDGREITVRANLDVSKGYTQAKKLGAKGVGLFRSEFLFNQYKGFPGEQEQIEAYRKIANSVGAEGVRIRTFDLSAEQLSDETEEREKNPALGLRAIRLGFLHLKEFRTQLRAILQAAKDANILFSLPMISDVAEIVQAKNLLELEKKSLQRKKIEFGNPLVGAMIEVPSAVFTVDEIVSEVDFVCLGTNDLVQYLLAVDRDNEAVADTFRTLHPAVLRSIKMVLQSAQKKGIPAIICGEMAGSPVYVPILIGLGAAEISMNINSIQRVSRVISQIAYEECVELVGILESCRTADEVENAVTDFYRKNWSHLFPKDVFPPKTKYKI